MNPNWSKLRATSASSPEVEGLVPLRLGECNQGTVLNKSRSSVASSPTMNPGLARICFARGGMSCTCTGGMSWVFSLQLVYSGREGVGVRKSPPVTTNRTSTQYRPDKGHDTRLPRRPRVRDLLNERLERAVGIERGFPGNSPWNRVTPETTSRSLPPCLKSLGPTVSIFHLAGNRHFGRGSSILIAAG